MREYDSILNSSRELLEQIETRGPPTHSIGEYELTSWFLFSSGELTQFCSVRQQEEDAVSNKSWGDIFCSLTIPL
jgi:hypothetical protein